MDELPEVVYISFDIDGLTIEHCPHTGTPVPGGITFEQVVYLMECVADSGRPHRRVRPGGGRSLPGR